MTSTRSILKLASYVGYAKQSMQYTLFVVMVCVCACECTCVYVCVTILITLQGLGLKYRMNCFM